MIQAFSQKRASRLTGLSVRQLEYWDETDVLHPSIAPHEFRGIPRLYSFQDLLRLGFAKVLRDHKMLPSEIRRMVRELEDLGFDEPLLTLRFLSPTTESGQAAREVYWFNPRTELPESARDIGQAAEVFDLKLVELRSGIEGKISDLARREPGHVVRLRGLRGRAPVLEGTRVPVRKLRRLSEAGWTVDQILLDFPHLTAADVKAALDYDEERVA